MAKKHTQPNGHDDSLDGVEFDAEGDGSSLLPLIEDFKCLIQELDRSSDQGNHERHAKHAADACRLSRRIRLRLGNPYEASETMKQLIVSLFRECVCHINLKMPYESKAATYTAKCRENIGSRAKFIEHPEKLEEELTALGA